MGKRKFTRITCMVLSLLFLVSGAVVTASADVVNSSVTDKTIADYADSLNASSYQEYMDQNFAGVNPAGQTVSFDATDNWVFTNTEGDTIELKDGSWTLTDREGNVYTSEAEAEAAGYDLDDLVRLQTYDGREAIYTPAVGSVTWTLDLGASGIDASALYHITFEYYPVVSKTASIERELLINGEIPFSEASSVTIPKRWASYQSDGTSTLTAVFVPDKKLQKANGGLEGALNAVMAEAEAAGLTAYLSEDGSSLLVEQPRVVTEASSKFLDAYEIRFFVTDITNNELRPTMVQTPEWMSYTLRDSGGYYANELGFVLTPDENGNITLSLNGINEPVAIGAIVLQPYDDYITYEEYLQGVKDALGGEPAEGQSVVKLEGEFTSNTSTNVVYPIEDRSDALTSPADPSRTMLNTIGAEKWETSGQWIQYQFQVDSSGMYEIFTRFKQSYLDGMYVGRMLMIYTADENGDRYESVEDYIADHGNSAGYYNGVPFEEATRLRFDYANGWQVKALSDLPGNESSFPVYFEAGVVYTLHLEVTLGSMSSLIQQVEIILDSLNSDYLDIIRLTGSSPDDYRDYNFARLLTNTLVDMIIQGRALAEVSATLKADATGVASSYTGVCDKLSNLLDKMGKDEDQIAKNLDNFKSYIGSLGTFLTDAKTQPLQIDYISIQGASVEPPKAAANFFRAIAHEFTNFIMSFLRDYNSMGAMATDEGTASTPVNVWLAYGRDQSQVIRNLCTNEFTPDTEIAVDLKLITAGTLLPSILAGMGPDAYLGLAQTDVINYAIRGALMNVEEMEGFDEVTQNFNEAAMMVLGTVDSDGDMHYYGLPETQTFPMMFIRTDILVNLGIEIPKTWEDIYIAQSMLESNNMEIGVTTDYKIFLYQMGGELFADGGMRINLDSTVGLDAFETMCNMFTQYSFPYKYEAANRFRTGEMPIIISAYTALYNQLKVFATEIDNCWTFVPLPGYESEDGTINNASVSTTTAAVLIANKENEYHDAWEFVKWYTDAPCQTEYANEMVAIIGDSAKQATANREALESMPWTRAEYIEVSKQFENLAAVPNYPGYYIIDRYTNFAFLSAYNDDADPTTELLSYINIINTEITRKREEFKLETLEIGQTLATKRAGQVQTAIAALQKLTQGNTKYDAAIQAANYAIANSRITQLEETSRTFAEILAGDWSGATMVITKADGKQMEVPDYYVNVGKQTSETKFGGYQIDSLNEQQLVYFISEALMDIAEALASY